MSKFATLGCVAWFNSQRLVEPLGYVPPAEFKEQLDRGRAESPVSVLN